MSSISLNSPGWKINHTGETKRPSAKLEGDTGFIPPGTLVPVEPVVVPIRPAPVVPTAPVPLSPGYGSPALPYFDSPTPFLKKMDQLNMSTGGQALDLYNKVAPYVAAFELGWKLGDYFWPHGFYYWGVNTTPDFSIGSEGWNNPRYDWIKCNAWPAGYPLAGAGGKCYFTTGPSVFPTGADVDCYQGNDGSAGHGTVTSPVFPGASTNVNAWQNCPLTHGAPPLPTPHRHLYGTFRLNGDVGHPYNPDEWVQHFLRPVTGPLVGPLSSEMPMTFPMTAPMDFPFAQSWADARPDVQEQVREDVATRVPLAPFPVFIIPEGSTLPTQVVTFPPPSPEPETGVQPAPDPAGPEPPTYETVPGGGGRRPPERGKKEKKLSVRSVANKAWIGLNLATEIFDFIDALFDALPQEVIDATVASIDYGVPGGGHADPYSKLLAIYNNFEVVDWDLAVTNFINNQIEDAIIGGIGMAGAQVNRLSGAATGGGGAVISRPSAQAEAASDAAIADLTEAGHLTEEGAKALDLADDLPIPQVWYDNATNSWWVTIPQWDLTVT